MKGEDCRTTARSNHSGSGLPGMSGLTPKMSRQKGKTRRQIHKTSPRFNNRPPTSCLQTRHLEAKTPYRNNQFSQTSSLQTKRLEAATATFSVRYCCGKISTLQKLRCRWRYCLRHNNLPRPRPPSQERGDKESVGQAPLFRPSILRSHSPRLCGYEQSHPLRIQNAT